MGLVHIYCGDGKGKTTASIGLSIRSAGSGMKVLFVQFFKNGNSNEIALLKKIDHITCLHSPKTFGRFVNMNDKQKKEAEESYRDLFQEAIERSAEFDMIVFDELISAYNYNMIDKNLVCEFIKENRKLEIVLTGRNPEIELLNLADYVSEIKKIKHPYDKGEKARKGIEF